MKGKRFLVNQLNQFIPVVLGVYIGILASNWNENRVRRAEQQEYIENLKLEIQANKLKIEETIDYQEAILKSSRQVRKELDQKTLETTFWTTGHWNLIPGWEGLKIPSLENAVHQSGIMTNSFSEMEFPIIHTISRSYNHQENYEMLAQRLILDNLSQMDNQVKTAEALNKLEWWQDIVFLGNELIAQYNATLRELNNL
jgi:hypothetical protein